MAVLAAQQPGAVKPADRAQVLADLGLVVPLIIIGGG
jgi:hypothetical protein